MTGKLHGGLPKPFDPVINDERAQKGEAEQKHEHSNNPHAELLDGPLERGGEKTAGRRQKKISNSESRRTRAARAQPGPAEHRPGGDELKDMYSVASGL